MSEPRIPTIDLRPWLSGDTEARREIARTVDEALQTAGFLLVTGHGVDPGLRTRIRTAARAFPPCTPKPCLSRLRRRRCPSAGTQA